MSASDISQVTDQMSKTTVDDTGIISFVGKGLKLDTEEDGKSFHSFTATQPHRLYRCEQLELKYNQAAAFSFQVGRKVP